MFVLAAKEYDQAGLLRPVEDLAWRIRSNVKDTTDALSALEQIGVTRATADGWIIVNFSKRQYGEIAARHEWNRIRKHMTEEVFDRDEHECRYCGSTDDLTIDHIIPLLYDGNNELDNLQILCRKCNSRKWVN